MSNDNDKKSLPEAKALKEILQELQIVKTQQEQANKMEKINNFLKKIHSDKDELVKKNIAQSTQKALFYKEKIDDDLGVKENIKKPYYYFRYIVNALEAKHYELYDFFRSSVYALFFAILIRSLFFQPFSIPSESMLPNLVVGDYIFVNKMSYGYSNYSFPFAPNIFKGRIFASEPKRGDVAVFRVVDDGNKDYIKRIIGIGGDKIQYKNGVLFVNNKQIPKKYLYPYKEDPMDYNAYMAPVFAEKLDAKKYNVLDVYKDAPLDNTDIFTVPNGHYFVSGDNRDNSQDSRIIGGAVGFVPQDRLIGRAEIIFFSLNRASFFEFWKWPFAIRFNRILKKIE